MILLLLLLLLFPITAFADETVTVDFSTVLGIVTYKASGVLHNISTTQPPDSTITPIKLQEYRHIADGVVDPTDSVEAVYARLTNLGATSLQGDLSLGFQSAVGGLPGDGGSYTAWTNYITNVFNHNQASGATNIIYDIWNEPDANFTNGNHFEAVRQAIVTVKALKPSVKTIAPTYSEYFTSLIHSFLTFCNTNNACPTYLSWHELANPASAVAAHIADANAFMDSIPMTRLPIVINEYGQNNLYEHPGDSTKYLAAFERSSSVISAGRSCWGAGVIDCNAIGSLSGLLMTDGTFQTRSGWWAYKVYGDMSGNMVTVTPQSSSGADGIAAVTSGQAITLIGRDDGLATENVTVKFTNLSSAPGFSGLSTVHVTATPIANSGANPLLALPSPVIDTNFTVTNNEVDVVLPNFGGVDAFEVVLTTSGTASLLFSPILLPSGLVGIAYSQDVTISNETSPYSCVGTTPPAGLAWTTVSPNICRLSGTPTTAQTVNTTITATDSHSPPTSTQQTYTVTIQSTNFPLVFPASGVVTLTGAFSVTIPANATSATLQVQCND